MFEENTLSIPEHLLIADHFSNRATLVGSILDPEMDDIAQLEEYIKRDGLEDHIRLERVEEGRLAGRYLVRFSTLTPLGAKVMNIQPSTFGLRRAQTVHRQDILREGDIVQKYQQLKAMMSDPRLYSHLEHFPDFSNITLTGEILPDDYSVTKQPAFQDAQACYYANKTTSPSFVSPTKLVFGEDHTQSMASESMQVMLNYFRENNIPIFLEFLTWEIFEPLLEAYYDDEKTKKHAIEERLREFVAKLPRNREENRDLFNLIQAARDAGVRIYPAETLLSFHMSNIDKTGAADGTTRLETAHYATTQIIESISPERFAVLYGNRHLLHSEELPPSLPEMLHGISIAFYDPDSPQHNQTASQVDISCARTEDNPDQLIALIMEKTLEKNRQTESAMPRCPSADSLKQREETKQMNNP